jgi:hypothetical protein
MLQTSEFLSLNYGPLGTVHSITGLRFRKLRQRMMRRAARVVRMWDLENACEILVGKHECKRQLWGLRRRSADNIHIYLTQMGYDDADWIQLAQEMTSGRLL